jgi:hypothetical protein
MTKSEMRIVSSLLVRGFVVPTKESEKKVCEELMENGCLKKNNKIEIDKNGWSYISHGSATYSAKHFDMYVPSRKFE